MSTDRYPINPADKGAVYEQRIRDLERQVRDLQSSRAIRSSTMAGGAMRVTSSGDEVARVGVGTYSGYAGSRHDRRSLTVRSPTGELRFLATAEDGLVWPPGQAQFGRLNDSITISAAGGFLAYWQAYVILSAGTISTVATCTADAGTTGEIRLAVGGTGLVTDARPIAAGGQTDTDFAWDLDALGVALGTAMFLNVHVRKVAGAGNVYTYLPRPAAMSDRVVFGGTMSGVPIPP